MKWMDNEEVRLRALLSIRTGDNKYIKDIPSYQQFAGLYPEILGQTQEMKDQEEIALAELKERLDKELEDNESILEKQTSVTEKVFKEANVILKTRANAILFAEYVSNDSTFDDFWSMSEEAKNKIYDLYEQQGVRKKPVSLNDPIVHNPTSYQIKVRDELRNKFKDLTINIGRGDRVLVNGKIIKTVIVCDYMEKTHEINIEYISKEIQRQNLDKV